MVKLTGTLIRTDGIELAGELVYKYKLSQAMANNYVKSLRNIEYVPEKLLLTIDKDESKQYTVEELLELGLRDEDWIRRSVAFSEECSNSVVDEIREIIIPRLITRFQIDQSKKNLSGCRLFNGKYRWIKNRAADNGALLGMYFNTYLRNEIGKKREEWKVSDFDIAFEKLPVVVEFVEKILNEYLQTDKAEK